MKTDVVSNPGTKWLLVLISQPLLALAMVGVLFIGLIVVLFWLPFLLFASPHTFDLDSQTGSAGAWWSAPTQLPATSSPYQWPVPHIRSSVRSSSGIDIAAPGGDTDTAMQPVYAMAAGTVTAAETDAGGHGRVVLDHGGGLVSAYSGLESGMAVTKGNSVAKGQMIGRIASGTGAHLHLEVMQNGSAVDPFSLVQPPASTMPDSLQFQEMNISGMKDWLDQRGSAMADITVLTAINEAGKAQNVDPYLLVAITGQEQSFVPKNGNHAAEIIRNPWNVFGCWCSGRGSMLTTEQSAELAAQTIVKLSQDRPDGFDPIEWIDSPQNPNGVYAEDTGWWLGVSRFYRAIHDEVPSS